MCAWAPRQPCKTCRMRNIPSCPICGESGIPVIKISWEDLLYIGCRFVDLIRFDLLCCVDQLQLGMWSFWCSPQ